MKLSFKKEARLTGLAAVARPYSSTTIKGDGKSVGSIDYDNNTAMNPKGSSKWLIRFTVEAEPQWKWIQFKSRFDTEEDARKFVTDKWPAILKVYKLHQLES